MNWKFREIAYAYKQKTGYEFKELGSLLWPDASYDSRNVNMSKLLNGKTNRIRIEWIAIICEELEVTPNELFGYETN